MREDTGDLNEDGGAPGDEADTSEAPRARAVKPLPSRSRAKTEREITRILKAATPEVARALVALATGEGVNPRIQLQACEAIMDRLYGRGAAPGADTPGGPVKVEFTGVLEEWSR